MTTDADLDRVIGNLFLNFAMRPTPPQANEPSRSGTGDELARAWPVSGDEE